MNYLFKAAGYIDIPSCFPLPPQETVSQSPLEVDVEIEAPFALVPGGTGMG